MFYTPKKENKMNLAIDVGNTRKKIGVFEDNTLIHSEVIFSEEDSLKKIFEVHKQFNCENAIIASVADAQTIIDILKTKINLVELSSQTKIPFTNKYSSPKTLGVDRIALISGAYQLFPNKSVLVIDAGTCITYDFINSKSEYLGGAISPGLQMRYKSLHHFTQKLPMLKISPKNHIIGNTTESSIHSGVVNGTVFEIEEMINRYKSKNKDLTIVLTGGDTKFLAKRLKNTIFANSSLLLEGLNSILIHNLPQK